jgi:acid phosphatase
MRYWFLSTFKVFILKSKLSGSVLVILVSIFISSCGPSLENLQVVKKDIMNYYEKGAYSRDLKDIISKAESEINNLKLTTNSAVVFDIDETSLSNYEIMKKEYFGYDQARWDNWVNEGRAPAIPEVKEFYDFLISKNIKVIFLTGRKNSQFDPTYRNLKNVGYIKFDTLILKNDSESNLTALEFKSNKREELSKKGYDIIASIGDQTSDLEGKNHGIQIKLPNYIYIMN